MSIRSRARRYSTRMLIVGVAAALASLGLPLLPAAATFGGTPGVIVFSGIDGKYTMSSDGSNVTLIPNTQDGDGEASWSPDGTRLAFTRTVNFVRTVFVMNADGTNLVAVTPPSDDAFKSTPDWSPDGSKLVIVRQLDTGDKALVVINSDGSPGSNVLTSGNLAFPAWSPDGSTIAYMDFDSSGHIATIPSGGGIPTRLTSGLATDKQPDWSPDGSKIAFISDRNCDISLGCVEHLWVMNADGTGQLQLDFFGPAFDDSPSWSPDGSRLVMNGYAADGTGPRIIMINADGSGRTALSADPATDQGAPDWQPIPVVTPPLPTDTAHRLFFSQQVPGVNFAQWDIFSMNPDGTDVVNISNTPNDDEQDLGLSFDGTKIAFTDTQLAWSAGEGTSTVDIQVWTMDTSGQNRTKITHEINHAYEPSWAPDGTHIAYSRAQDLAGQITGAAEIAVVNADGTNPHRVISSPEQNTNAYAPAYSPDGTKIAFTRNRPVDGYNSIMVANSDGTNVHEVIGRPGGNVNPAWSPDGSRLVFESQGRCTRCDVGASTLWVADADGNNVRQLTDHVGSVWDEYPTWSPDGSTIAFDERTGSGYRVMTVPSNHPSSAPTAVHGPTPFLGFVVWQWSVLPPAVTDTDGDGINDDIDVSPAGASASFDDHGGTTGMITDPAGLTVTVADAPVPDGVTVTVGAGAGQVSLQVCAGFTVKINAGSTVTLTCGSVLLKVTEGAAHVVLGGGVTIVDVPAGGTGKVTDDGDGTFTVQNLGGTGDVTITAPSGTTTVPPGGTQAHVAAIAPTNVTPASVIGVAHAGSTLICSPGTWNGAPAPDYSYVWLRNNVVIANEISDTYDTRLADSNRSIRCQVTATNLAGSATSTSAPFAIPLVTAPAPITLPSVSGTMAINQTRTCSQGVWTGEPPPTFTFQWQRNNVDVPGANDPTYTLTSADLGTNVRCVVTASNIVRDVIRQTANVRLPAVPVSTTAPHITGTMAVAQRITCANGSWSNVPTSFTYTWSRNGSPLPGVTTSSYVIVGTDGGATFRCQVTASNAGGSATSLPSAARSVPAAPVPTAQPTITPTTNLVVGRNMTCNRGTWAGTGVSYTRQWLRNGTPIAGRTGINYTLVAADRGRTLGCAVTATNAGGAVTATATLPIP